MEKAGKAEKAKGKARDRISSQCGSEAQATEGSAGENLAEDNFTGIEALVAPVMEFQEEEEVGVVADPDKEWLAAGPQAPELDPDQHTYKRAAAHGATTSNPVLVVKRVKKATRADVSCHQSPHLAQAKASSA